MNIKPNPSTSITQDIVKNDVKKPVSISAGEQIASEMRSLDNEKGVNLAITSSDPLRTVLEDISHIRVLASKIYAGKVQDSDKNVVQTRIDMIKNDIKKSLSNTEFNKYRNLVPDPQSSQGRMMKIKNTSLETLGIESFDVRKNSNISDLDVAMRNIKKALRNRQPQTSIPQNINKMGNVQSNKVTKRVAQG